MTTTDELLQYIASRYEEKPLRPDGFGIISAEYAEAIGISKDTASQRLNALCKSGVLQKREMRVKVGRSAFSAPVYARPEDWQALDK